MSYHPVLTKSKYMVGLKCKRSLWIMFNEKDKIPPFDEATLFRFDQGHEIGEIVKKLYPDGIDIACDDFKQNLSDSMTLLGERKPLFEAGYMFNHCFSRADILLPVGFDEWDVVEVKSSTSVKEDHINDLAFQRYCYEGIGIKIRKTFLMHVNNQYERNGELDLNQLFSKEDITDEVIEKMDGIEDRIKEQFEIVKSRFYDEEKWRKHCDSYSSCPMPDLDFGEINETSIFNLYYGGNKVLELFDKGIRDIKEIPGTFRLNSKQEIQFKCTKEETEHIDKQSLKKFLGTLKYPLFFLDFECYSMAIPRFDKQKPYQQIPFQFSLHIIDFPGLPPRHVMFLANDKEDPRDEFIEKLVSNLKPNGSIIVYHQAFEKSVLRKLIEYDPQTEFFFEDVISRFVDLIVPFRNFDFYSPKQQGSFSLKKVLPSLTEKSYDNLEICDGDLASILYYKMQHLDVNFEEKKKIKENLIKYSTLDTEAMVDIIEALREKVR